MDILKTIMDALANRVDNSLVFIVNIKEDNSINFICRNKIASLSAGYLVKQIVSQMVMVVVVLLLPKVAVRL